MTIVKISSFLTSLLLLCFSSLPLRYCQEANETLANLGLDVTVRYNATDDVTTNVTEPNDSVAQKNGVAIVTEATTGCSLSTVDPFVHNIVTQHVKENRASLIEYRLSFANYTINPLTTSDVIDAYRATNWARITTSHGQTLLSLAFNYGVLSMSTLTLGTMTLYIELVDSPAGCFGTAAQSDKIASVQYLLMRDFKANGPLKTVDDARVCHEVILDDNGYAQFRHNCCYVNTINKREECTTEIGNIYLDMLYAMLAIVRVGLLFFSPVIFISAVEGMSKDSVPYVVKLRDKLIKTAWICSAEKSSSVPPNLKPIRTLDLRTAVGFPKLQKKALELKNANKLDKKQKIQFDQYDITVDYKRTLKENTVPVGLFQTLFRTLLKCRIRHTGPFKDCCKTNIFTTTQCRDDEKETGVTWSTFCRQFSKFILVLIIPFPLYIRLWLFYAYEEIELYARKEAMAVRGLREHYDNSVVHYFTPSHFFFICMYLIYIMSAVVIAFIDKRSDDKFRPKSIIVNSFKDLKKLNWTDVLSMAVSNFIWPLKRFGIYGCVIGLVYWPLVLLYTAFICICFLLPTLYLCLRIMYYAKTAIFVKERRSKNVMYQVKNRIDKDMYKLETDRCIRGREDKGECLPYPQGHEDKQAICDDVDYIRVPHYKPAEMPAVDENKKPIMSGISNEKASDSEKEKLNKDPAEKVDTAQGSEGEGDDDDEDGFSLKSEVIYYAKHDWRRVVESVLSAFLGIMTLFSCVIILSEVIGCLVEIATFTIMGVIVNAGTLLRYVMLLLMIFVYCCDCFNNITKKYLKMNKALFGEVKFRINKDLEQETSQPSHLQQNRGFKSQELSQQAAYELPDDIAEKVPRHWIINDLVMFVDNEDMPRIPRKLFELVCNIRVAGVPGPVYRGHIEAVTSLTKIILFVCFVFVIVLSFGTVYKVSSTNQMLATLLGGFLPMVLRTFLAPPAPDVELGTVSFKSKMDEVIKNFCQYWPIHDLPFELVPETPESDDKSPEPEQPEKDEITNVPAGNNNSGGIQEPEKIVDTVDSSVPVDGGPSTFAQASAAISAGLNPSGLMTACMLFSMNATMASTLSPRSLPGTTREPVNDVEKKAKDTEVVKKSIAKQDDDVVDLLIYLPQDTFEGRWLPEWSEVYSDNHETGV